MIRCPECGAKFEEDPDLMIGDIAYCPDCYIELKVIAIDPVKVKALKDNYSHNNYLDDSDDDVDFYHHEDNDGYEDEEDFYEN
jgi:lysine biosynthesis protein LysW